MSGEEQIIANLQRLAQAQIAAIPDGLRSGAARIESDAAATTAYQGMSGATRASTVAYVVGAGADETSQATAAANTAAGLLQNFTGHEGRSQLSSVPGPGLWVAWIILTVMTDYILKLETERAGEKAFIADTLLSNAPVVFGDLIQAFKGAFHL